MKKFHNTIDKILKIAYNKSKEYNESKGCDFMELAKITSKGQITLPISIRRILNLKDGDKVAFIEKDGNIYTKNCTRWCNFCGF